MTCRVCVLLIRTLFPQLDGFRDIQSTMRTLIIEVEYTLALDFGNICGLFNRSRGLEVVQSGAAGALGVSAVPASL